MKTRSKISLLVVFFGFHLALAIPAAVVVGDTGSRISCKSRFGAFDMVGNLLEWVADWVPILSGSCGSALFAGDLNCLAGTT